jgi:hypothetical protein
MCLSVLSKRETTIMRPTVDNNPMMVECSPDDGGVQPDHDGGVQPDDGGVQPDHDGIMAIKSEVWINNY